MRHLGPMALIGASLVALILMAGFFAEATPRSASEAPAVCPPAPLAMPAMRETYADARPQDVAPSVPPRGKGLLNLTNAPGYRRGGALSPPAHDRAKTAGHRRAQPARVPRGITRG